MELKEEMKDSLNGGGAAGESQTSPIEVRVAKTAGFCFGVKRAVEQVYEQIKKGNGPIYTYGPIIHNEEVVSFPLSVRESSSSVPTASEGRFMRSLSITELPLWMQPAPL